MAAVFGSSLDVALDAPDSATDAAAGDSDDGLVLAAVALLLLVFAGLKVVRTSAQALRTERPA